MTSAIEQAEKQTFFLVRFENEITGTLFAAFTTLDSDYNFEGVDYESETRLTISLPRNDGAFSEEPCLIGLPRSHQFAQDVSSGQLYPATLVVVIEIVKGEGAISTTINRPFNGLMTLARRRVGGRSETITISATTIKARLQNIPLGLPCMQNCVNRLGDKWCKKELLTTPQRVTVVVTAIDGPVVTVSGSVPTGLEDRYYQRGSLTRDGFEFLIRDWRNEVAGDRFTFYLMRRPPDSWIGNSAVLLAGCDKTPRTCEERHNNLANFRGPGFKMLPYNPLFEDGSSRV